MLLNTTIEGLNKNWEISIQINIYVDICGFHCNHDISYEHTEQVDIDIAVLYFKVDVLNSVVRSALYLFNIIHWKMKN